MAVSAKFIADFTQFEDAVQKSTVKLRSFQDGIGRVDRDLARFGNQFSGVRIVQDVTLAARAIEKLGEEGGIAAGLTKLTANELQRVGAMAKEAAAKLTAMGQDVPQNIRRIVDAVTPLPEKLSLADRAAGLAKSTFGQMFGAFTAANLINNAVSSLVNFGKAAFESAGRTADLSAKLGIGTEAIQRMEFVANQTGGTVEQFASSAFKLQTRIAGGSNSVEAAVKALGLSFTQLKQLKPEQQFETVVGALSRMDDATKRNELGVKLFGKSFEQIAASVAQGYDEIARQANISSDAQIQALDRAGDALDRWKANLKTFATSTLGEAALAIENFWEKVFPVVDEEGVAVKFVGEGNSMAKIAAQAKAAAPAGPPEDFVANLKKAQAAVAALTAEQRTQIDAALKLGVSMETLSDRYGISEEALKLYTGSVKSGTKSHNEFARATDQLFSRDVIAKANDYVRMIGNVAEVSKLSKEKQSEVNKVLGEAIAAYGRLGQEAPRAMIALRNAVSPTTRELHDELRKLETVVDDTVVSLRELSHIPPPLEAFQRDLFELETTFQTTGIDGLLINLGDELKEIADLGERPAGTIDKLTDAIARFDIVGTLVRAFEGGGGITGALQSIGTRVGAELGKAIGTKLGGALGGEIGEAAGSLLVKGIVKGVTSKNALVRALTGFAVAGPLGAIAAGIFGGRGPSRQELEGREVVRKFEEQLAATLSTAQRLEAGNERWKMTVIAVRDAYLATGRSAAEAERDVKRLWDSSRRGAEAAAREAERINEILLEAKADQDRLNAAIQKYGFTLEQLGPAFRRQQLDYQAKELIEDWRVLVASGIDISLVNEKMSSSISDYFNMARRTGTEIPAAFKPILEMLAKQGKLQRTLTEDEKARLETSKARIAELETLIARSQSPEEIKKFNLELNKQKQIVDELSGQSFSSLEATGVKFSETMTEGFDRVVKKLDELIRKLQGAGVEIDSLPTNIVVDVEMRLRKEQVEEYIQSLRDRLLFDRGSSVPDRLRERFLTDPNAALPAFAAGTRGRFMDFGQGTLAVLHGKERVMTQEEGRAGDAAYSRSDAMVMVGPGAIVIHAEGQDPDRIAEAVEERLIDFGRRNHRGFRTRFRGAYGVA